MSIWSRLSRLFSRFSAPSEQPPIEGLQDILGYHFRDLELLRLALSHRSLARIDNRPTPSNERLEFLGDAVLGLIISFKLYRDNPLWREGDLTKLKAVLVSETTLFRIGRDIGLNSFVLLSPEEDRAGGRLRPSIVSDAFEAVIGAVFLDGGFEAARAVVNHCIYSRQDAIVGDDSQRNYKGELLELIQAQGNGMPQYVIVNESGPDHDKIFHAVVTINDHSLGEGTGPSKKDAEQQAARRALEGLAADNHLDAS
jgi:ribonuclease-3